MKFIFLIGLFVSQFAGATEEISPKVLARVAASLFNESKTANGFLKRIEFHYTVEEISAVRQMFEKSAKKDHSSLDASLPAARADGPVLIIDKADFRIEFKGDRTVVSNGKEMKLDGPLDEIVKKLMNSRSSAGAVHRLLLPSAHADPYVLLLLAGTIGYATAGVAAVGTAGVWITSQAYQALRYGKGRVVCDDDGNFVVQKASWGFSAHERRIANDRDVDAEKLPESLKINIDAAKQMLKEPGVRCTPNYASTLQKIMLESSPLRFVETDEINGPGGAGSASPGKK